MYKKGVKTMKKEDKTTPVKQEFNHLWSGIANTKENRDKITKLNTMARESNSMHRYRIKYRRPKAGTSGYWGGGCAKDDAQVFSVYLRASARYDIQMNQLRMERYQERQDERLKYDRLKNKYNSLILKSVVDELLENVQELSYAVEQNVNPNDLIRSLRSVGGTLLEDLNERLEK